MDKTRQLTQDYTADSLVKIDMPKVASARMYRLPPYLFGRINAQKIELRRQGVDIIDLGMGNPNDPTPEAVVEKLTVSFAFSDLSAGVFICNGL